MAGTSTNPANSATHFTFSVDKTRQSIGDSDMDTALLLDAAAATDSTSKQPQAQRHDNSNMDMTSSHPSTTSIHQRPIHEQLNTLDRDFALLTTNLNRIDRDTGHSSYTQMMNLYSYELHERSLLAEKYAHQLNVMENNLMSEGKRIGLFYQQPAHVIKQIQLQQQQQQQQQKQKQHHQQQQEQESQPQPEAQQQNER
jgi:hypothetical protein